VRLSLYESIGHDSSNREAASLRSSAGIGVLIARIILASSAAYVRSYGGKCMVLVLKVVLEQSWSSLGGRDCDTDEIEAV
jgi:hypothetical protein